MTRRRQRRNLPSGVRTIVFLIGLSIGVMEEAQGASSGIPVENRIKAAFLVELFSDVDWPADAVPASGDQFVVGVVGEGPTTTALLDLRGLEMKEGRRLVVKRLTNAGDFGSCHMLFFSEEPGVDVRRVLGEIVGNAVLTVGETDDFARMGGMVRFYFASNRVRFEINPAASRAAGLRISSRLLRLAKIVDDREGR